MKKNTTYLITGGTGFIGTALSNKLQGNIIILSKRKVSNAVKKKNIKYLIKPVRKITEKDLFNVDVIYHCASTNDNYNVLSKPYLDVDTNVKETIHLLEVCKNLPIKPKIIFLSTFFVYGNNYQKYRERITEESPTDPLSLYSASKLCAESVIALYGRLYKIPYVIARLTNIYGPKDRATDRKGVLNYFVQRSTVGKTLSVYGDGKFRRDYLHIDDLVDALLILEKKGNSELFLVGSGESTQFIEIIRKIHKLSASKSNIVFIPIPEFHKVVGVFDFACNIKKMRGIGFVPKISTDIGLKKLVDGIQKSKINEK